eukprot:SAG31_NODE_5956_length_2242_cov_1.588894_3_plen_62_part_00
MVSVAEHLRAVQREQLSCKGLTRDQIAVGGRRESADILRVSRQTQGFAGAGIPQLQPAGLA